LFFMTRARPTETERGRTQRERVLRAAMDIFSTQGFRGASLDAVAEAVGMTRQGLLHYFPSKVQLLLGVLELRHAENSVWMQQMFERTRSLGDALIALVGHNQDRPELVRLFTVLAAESVDADHPGHQRFVDRYRFVRTDMIQQIAAEQEAGTLSSAIAPEHLAVLLIAVMDGLQLQYLLEPDAVDMVRPLADLLALLEPGASTR
jgi:AcrR family transcriptional regulator